MVCKVKKSVSHIFTYVRRLTNKLVRDFISACDKAFAEDRTISIDLWSLVKTMPQIVFFVFFFLNEIK